MKKVTFFCDLCNKEIEDSINDPCIVIDTIQAHNWDDPAKARKIFSGCVCKNCGDKIESFIKDLQNQIIEEV